jgi:hypothetical protein
MYYSTATTRSPSRTRTCPGVVLAVSPEYAQLLINDQVRQVFYLYTVSSGTSTTFGGMGTAAQWTPDSKTLYITDSARVRLPREPATAIRCTSTTSTPAGPAIPLAPSGGANPGAQNPGHHHSRRGSVPERQPDCGAYLVPAGNVGQHGGIVFYPQGDSVDALTDVLAATTDGQHILGAAVWRRSGHAFRHWNHAADTVTLLNGAVTPATCPLSAMQASVAADDYAHVVTSRFSRWRRHATAVNQVVPAPNSRWPLLPTTATRAGATLPYYFRALAEPGR